MSRFRIARRLTLLQAESHRQPDRRAPARRRGSRLLLVVLITGLLVSVAGVLPARVAAGEPGAVPARLEGYLKLIAPGSWWVGDAHVIVNDQTIIIEKRGHAEVGAWVVVQGTQDPEGTLVADFVIVERPAGPKGILWPFAGVLTKQANNLWVISDILVRVTPETSISGAPEPGWLVWVIAEQRSDSLELIAVAIEAIANDPARVPVEFEGILEAMEPEWRVAGHTFRLSDDVRFLGTPIVGQEVEVAAIVQPDGSLVAYLVRVVDTSADAQVGALIADITAQPDGEQVWDLLIFPAGPSAEPFAGTALVGADTAVDESRAVAQPGQWVDMQGTSVGKTEYRADVIRVDRPVPVTVSGELRRAGIAGRQGSSWIVNGTSVWTDAARSAQLAGIADGQVVIQGVRLGNGVLFAERITAVTVSPAGTLR